MAQSQHDEPAVIRFERPTRLLIVAAPFYRAITDALLTGAQTAIAAAGATADVVEVPGALEIPPAIRLASRSGDFDGYVAIGCVIRGETSHYDTVCAESARGVMDLGLSGLCVGNGILTVENNVQAEIRADPTAADKGGGAALAAMKLIRLDRRFRPGAAPLPEGTIRVAGGGEGSVA